MPWDWRSLKEEINNTDLSSVSLFYCAAPTYILFCFNMFTVECGRASLLPLVRVGICHGGQKVFNLRVSTAVFIPNTLRMLSHAIVSLISCSLCDTVRFSVPIFPLCVLSLCLCLSGGLYQSLSSVGSGFYKHSATRSREWWSVHMPKSIVHLDKRFISPPCWRLFLIDKCLGLSMKRWMSPDICSIYCSVWSHKWVRVMCVRMFTFIWQMCASQWHDGLFAKLMCIYVTPLSFNSSLPGVCVCVCVSVCVCVCRC